MKQLAILPVGAISPNPHQPRKFFDEESLRELAASIAEHGVIQPVEVEETADGCYLLHHGERRWRAAQLAGLAEIPALVDRPLGGPDLLIRALVENVQRQDMTIIEEAYGYRALLDAGFSQMAIARRTGQSINHIAHALAWLEFEPAVQHLVASGALPKDKRAREALATVPAGLQVEFARKVQGQTVAGIQKAAAVLAESLKAKPAEAPAGGRQNCPPPKVRPGSRRAHALTLVLGDCPVPGTSTHSAQVETAAQATCNACPFFEYKPAQSCQECPATIFIRHYVKLVEVHV